MEMQTRYALTPIAGAIATALAPAHQALAQDTDDSAYALEEIIVTATKRSVSLQDVPATVMAITQESLQAMGAKGNKSYEQSASNALSALKKAGHVNSKDGKYTAKR